MAPITPQRSILIEHKYQRSSNNQFNGSSSPIHRLDTVTRIEAMCSRKPSYYQSNNSNNSTEYPESTTATDCSTDTAPLFKSPANPGRPHGPFCFKTITNNGITTAIHRTSNSLRRIFSKTGSSSNNKFYEIEEHIEAYKAIEQGASDNMVEILNGHLETIFGVAHIIEYKKLVEQSRHNSKQSLEQHMDKIIGATTQRPTSLDNPAHIAEYKKLEVEAQHRSEQILEGHMMKLMGAVPQRSLSLNHKNNTAANMPDRTPTRGNVSAQRRVNIVERAEIEGISAQICGGEEEEEYEEMKEENEKDEIEVEEKKVNGTKMAVKRLFSGCFSR